MDRVWRGARATFERSGKRLAWAQVSETPPKADFASSRSMAARLGLLPRMPAPVANRSGQDDGPITEYGV